MENQVSIIINGVRYDAVSVEERTPNCMKCDMRESKACVVIGNCAAPKGMVFKKSDKKFEP